MAAPTPTDLLLPSSAVLFAQGIVWLFEQSSRSEAHTADGGPGDGEPALCGCRLRNGEALLPPVKPSRPAVLMTQTVYSRLLKHLLRTPPEAGGALIGPRDCELVTHYVPNAGERTETSFTLDHETLNRQLARFLEVGLDLKGIVHSHPAGVHSPSTGDRHYLERLLGNPKNQQATTFAFPIVCDGRLWPYVAVRAGREDIEIRQATLTLI
ncbi:MAG: Mov34/MPN/PAD-1 family protein [Gemmataceae bacterium]